MRLIKLFFLVTFSTFIIGCVPKFNKVKATEDSKVLDELNLTDLENADVELSVKWWESFKDSQLDSIINKALKESPSLKSIEQRFEKANSLIKAIESQNLPNISLESTLTRERFSANHIFPAPLGGGMFTGYHVGTKLDYKFDFWNERKSQIKSAVNRAMAQKAFIEESRLTLALEITKLYLSWSFNEKKIEELEKIASILEKEFDIINQKYKIGLIDEITLNNKNAQIFQAKLNIYSLNEIIKGEKSSICILAGFLPSYAENLNKPTISSSINIGLPKDISLNLLSNRADITIQKYIVLSNQQNINVAAAKFYPNINLSALLGFTSFDRGEFLAKSSSVPSLGVALDLPIFDWGRREANLEDKYIDYNTSVYEYNNSVNRAVNEVVGVLKKLEYKNLELEMHEKEIKAKEINEEILNKKFISGLSDKIPYYDSTIDVLLNHISGLELIKSHANLELELIKSLGGGFREKDMKNDKN